MSDWLDEVRQNVKSKVGSEYWDGNAAWSDFLEQVLLWLHDQGVGVGLIQMAAEGLIKYGIRAEKDLLDAAGDPPNRGTFKSALKDEAVPPTVSDKLFKKYIISETSASVDRPSFFGVDNDDEWNSYMENKPSVDEGASEFLRRIAEATVKVLDPVTTTDWKWPELTEAAEADKSISIIKVDFPADEEAMDDGITMVQLPLPNPSLPDNSRSDRVFVRNEDVGLIKHWSSPIKELDDTEVMRIRSVVLGNPGISKSWHLWKYLLMAASSDLWKFVTGGEEFPYLPEVIAFVTSDTSVRVYYLNDKVVHEFENRNVLKSLNALSKDGSVRMLYEPALSFQPIPHDLDLHKRIPCVAALSPLLLRYKEYLKQYNQAAPHIMPCPTWPEIEAITRFLFKRESDAQMEAIVQIMRERYQKVGPFLRILFATEENYDSYLGDLDGELKTMTLGKAHAALNTIEADEKTTKPNPSHMIARYTTPKSYEGKFTIKKLVPASQLTQNRILDRLEGVSIERLRAIMVHYEEGTDDNESNPKALETLLCKYISSSEGLKWSYGQCQITFNTKGKDPAVLKATSIRQNALDLKKASVCNSSSPKASEMTVDKLYQPRDVGYPFVDLLWIDETVGSATADTAPPMSTAQCTVSDSHAKDLSVYEKLRESLGMPNEQVLIVYMATLPRCVESYLVGPNSTFFQHTTKRRRNEEFSFPENIEFRVLLPPQDMKNSTPDPAWYAEAMNQVYKQPARSSPRSLARAQANATGSV